MVGSSVSLARSANDPCAESDGVVDAEDRALRADLARGQPRPQLSRPTAVI